MSEFFAPVLDAFSAVLLFIHDLVEPIVGVHAWGWAIIGLTLLVRILLLPLAIKQTRSMKAMQKLQPQLKAIQDKYKTDREMMRKDPEKYRARKQKQQQEMMALYQQEGANPAASCLPLLAQAPVFLALFRTLSGNPDLTGAPFYFFTEASAGGLEKVVSVAGWPGWLLIVLMSGTMFFSQKQMMARNKAMMADSPMAQQQKVLLYVMPVFLAAVSFQFPLGILLYWVTTNLWQIVQQAVVLREGARIDEAEAKRSDSAAGPGAAPSGPARGATSGRPADRGAGRGAEERPEKRPAKGQDDGRAKDRTKGPEGAGETPTTRPENSSNSSSNGSGDRSGRSRLPRRGDR